MIDSLLTHIFIIVSFKLKVMEKVTSGTTITNSLDSKAKNSVKVNEMKPSRPVRNVRQPSVYSEYDVSYISSRLIK